MNNIHDEANERLVLRVTADLVGELRPELASFLRHLQLEHLLEEMFLPLAGTTPTRFAAAYEERPWPPAGVGARAIRGLAMAVVSSDGQALLTPCLLSPHFITNVGLAAALTKILLEDLANTGVDAIAFFVNVQSKIVAGELAAAGFEPRTARILTEGTEFVAHVARPTSVLDNLGLADARLGDVLGLRLERSQVSRLVAFHLPLAAGAASYWAGQTPWAEIFPGHIEWASLPPGGITGTRGPVRDEAADSPVLIMQ